MFKKFITLTILFLSAPAFADQAADKAEFKRLYAEFNDLYANSEDLEPIIDVAEKVYAIAPKAYGEKHKNTAVATYNLASLYDEKGSNETNESEKKAVELYKSYFKILNDLKAP